MKSAFTTLSVIILLFSSLLILTQCMQEHHGPRWSYTGKTAPAYWGDMKPEYLVCKTGKLQSPIDIAGQFEKSDMELVFKYSPSPLKIINNGHSVQVNFPGNSTLVADGKNYQLLQFHFHSPSEEAIKGKHADMCAHLVHKSSDGELAVIGVFLNIGAENNIIKTIWDNMPTKAGKQKSMADTLINAKQLLPENKSYYAYMGSLTTPPCTENVRWYILSEAVTVSQEQVKKFKSIFPKSTRPLQPLNGRKIRQGLVPSIRLIEVSTPTKN